MCSHRGIHSTTPFTFLLIPSTPSTTSNTNTTFTSMENLRVYLVIVISIYDNIIYKQVTEIVKDI